MQRNPTHPSCKNGGEDPPGARQPDITAFNFGYDPSGFTTTVGNPIVIGVTEGKHTFTSVLEVGGDPIFDSGRLNGGKTFEITGLGSGTYAYFCMIHGFDRMNDTLTIN